MSITFEFQGGAEFERAFNELGHKVQNKISKQVIKDATRVLELKIKSKARSVFKKASGKLARSISGKVKKNRRGFYGVVSTGKRQELKIDSEDRYYYPSAIEFGTKNIKAKPFMRTGFENANSLMVKIMRNSVKREIENTMRKLQKSGAKKTKKK